MHIRIVYMHIHMYMYMYMYMYTHLHTHNCTYEQTTITISSSLIEKVDLTLCNILTSCWAKASNSDAITVAISLRRLETSANFSVSSCTLASSSMAVSSRINCEQTSHFCLHLSYMYLHVRTCTSAVHLVGKNYSTSTNPLGEKIKRNFRKKNN